MIKIGLTGGIGSGKTTVAHILEQEGYPVYISDRQASELINKNREIRSALTGLFGTSLYSDDNNLDKKKLAEIIFNDKTALQKVNAIVHPVVLEDFRQWSLLQSGNLVFFESAILFEAGLEKNFDRIISVYASRQTRIQRVVDRDKVCPEQVIKRIENQMADDIKCQKSDFTIYTDRGLDLNQQIKDIIEQLNQKQ
ncbi:dephospho-CoA kinase [Culturomica massiliensis]|uniref:dephospho-CoA kinase n=1 Tax=Culturomica massiliensis TaxID=1841857 RepID=UPI0026709C3F|nr:dephospho-CoA kinase [Culturomica massiliensis]